MLAVIKSAMSQAKTKVLAFTVALPLIWTYPYDKTGIWGINHTCSQTQEVKKM